RATLVGFENRSAERRTMRANVEQRRFDVLPAGQTLSSVRNVDSHFAKKTAASRFRAPAFQPWIRGVHRNPETNGEGALQRRGIEDSQICLGWVSDALANPLQESRSVQDLLGERLRRAVMRTEKRQPISRVTGRNPSQQLQV